MVKEGFTPIVLDDCVTIPGVDRAEVIKRLESTIDAHRAGAVNAESLFGSSDRCDRGSRVSRASRGKWSRTKAMKSMSSTITSTGPLDRAAPRRIGGAWRPLRLAASHRAGM